MFKYTFSALEKIKKDMELSSALFSGLVIIIYIAYLSYSIHCGTGNMYLNIFLIVASVGYLAFFIISHIKGFRKNEFSAAKHVYKIAKHIANALTLIIAIYGIIIGNASKKAIISTIAIGALWIIQIILQLVIFTLENRIDLITVAFKRDFSLVLKTINLFGAETYEIPQSDDPYMKELDRLAKDRAIVKKEKKADKRKRRLAKAKSKAKQLLHIK